MAPLSVSSGRRGSAGREQLPVTVGVDIGTTSVKSVAVDAEGRVLARARVPHQILVNEPDFLEHDAKKAWRQGPRRAFAAVAAELSAPVAGVAVASMVPSVTAVDRRGVPTLPGLLYGDARARATGADPSPAVPEARGFLEWAAAAAPSAAGYWPCQGVATCALSGVAAIDTATAMVYSDLHGFEGWQAGPLAALGARPDQMPVVVQMGAPAATMPGRDTVVAGGTIDALCDQLVCDASEPGDVFAIFGATLVVWVVTDEWVERPGLVTVPHTVPDRVLLGGPSNAGALFVDWARRTLRVARPGPGREGGDAPPVREGDPRAVPVWLPYLRGERTPFNDPDLRGSLVGLDLTQGPAAVERAAFEASGFVIRRMIERSGVAARRVVASGGGTKVAAWMAAVADATGLPVDPMAVPEGAAYGAAYLARMAAGLETSIDGARAWARTAQRMEPDARWAEAASGRYLMFEAFSPSA